MTVSGSRIQVFAHDTESYVSEYGGTHDIYDQFWSLQDLQWPRDKVLEGFLCNIAVTDPSDAIAAVSRVYSTGVQQWSKA